MTTRSDVVDEFFRAHRESPLMVVAMADEIVRLRSEAATLAADGERNDAVARAAVEIITDCRKALGIDVGDSLTARVIASAKDAARYRIVRDYFEPELADGRWRVTLREHDLREAVETALSFDTADDVDIDAAIDTARATP